MEDLDLKHGGLCEHLRDKRDVLAAVSCDQSRRQPTDGKLCSAFQQFDFLSDRQST
jgi:hypothetical protein